MSVLGFCFLSVIFVVVFRSMKRRREKTRVSFRLRGADAVTAILFFFVAPVVLHSFCFYRIGGIVSIFKTFRA